MPAFVNMGFEEYAKRFPREVSLELVEIPAGKRTKNSDIEKIVNHEGELMLAAVPKGAMIVTMDIPGKMHNTHQLADELNRWKSSGRDVALLVGGPEGLSQLVPVSSDPASSYRENCYCGKSLPCMEHNGQSSVPP